MRDGVVIWLADRQWMTQEGHNWDKVWAAMCDVICKSLIAVAPSAAHQYRALVPPQHGAHACFELLGALSLSSICCK